MTISNATDTFLALMQEDNEVDIVSKAESFWFTKNRNSLIDTWHLSRQTLFIMPMFKIGPAYQVPLQPAYEFRNGGGYLSRFVLKSVASLWLQFFHFIVEASRGRTPRPQCIT